MNNNIVERADLVQLVEWIEVMSPLMRAEIQKLSHVSYQGVRVAYAAHIEPKMIPYLAFFLSRGMELHISPCVPGIQNVDAFAYLKARGARIYGTDAQTEIELETAWEQMLRAQPTHIFDIGGGLISKAVENRIAVKAACEATSTGITRLQGLSIPFPVFNWNDIPFKNLMHNRYDVAPGIWFAFRKLTGLDLCRLRVGVMGYGLVGQGLAAMAHGAGARVTVLDKSPMRQLEAASEGYSTAQSIKDLFECSEVVVTATGGRGVISTQHLVHARDRLILLNAGHDSHEIDLTGINPSASPLPDVQEFIVNGKRIYVLAEGRLLNLAVAGGSSINTFDLITALMIVALDHTVRAGSQATPGLQLLPADRVAHLEEQAARQL